MHYVYRWALCGDEQASLWLAREGIEVKVRSYEYGWRTVMLGSIQLFSGSKVTHWMDSILAPHPRRDIFLGQLQGDDSVESKAQLDQLDLDWINNATSMSVQGAETMKRDFALSE